MSDYISDYNTVNGRFRINFRFDFFKEQMFMLSYNFSPLSYKNNVKDFIFNKYVFKIYILADIKLNCRKSRFIQKQRRLLKKNIFKKKIVFFYLKDCIFHKYFFKMYKL